MLHLVEQLSELAEIAAVEVDVEEDSPAMKRVRLLEKLQLVDDKSLSLTKLDIFSISRSKCWQFE
jgi:hypothetical protein